LYDAVEDLPHPDDLEIILKEVLHTESDTPERRTQLIQEHEEQFIAEGRPYAFFNTASNKETCNVCGDVSYAGYTKVINPELGEYFDVPYVALHSMQEHSTEDYDGSENKGTVDVELLRRIVGLTDTDSD